MNIPKISVVTSVFNGGAFLRHAVESILDQSLTDFEFIIIDDGSSDTSPSILDSYQRQDPRVRVYHQENKGLVESLNRGCGLALGKYIARMDADDIAVRERLSWQIDFMEEHPDVAVLGGAVEFIDQKGKVLKVARHPLHNREIQRVMLDQSVMWHPTVLIRKSAFIEARGYRHIKHAEDYDLWLRIAEHAQLANLPEVLLKYRIHPDQISVANCRKQAVGALAARLAAVARKSGNPDPLNSDLEITPAVLMRLGMTEAMQHAILARGYLSSIRNMSDAGEHALALDMLEILRTSELEYAEAWTIADLWLCAAKLYWQQGQAVRTMCAVGHAFITRPVIVGRPLKTLLSRVGAMLRSSVSEPRKSQPSS
jgi:glycosyltransferase involved in cell wall biosynthesis